MHSESVAYAPLAQIAARAMIRHRLLSPDEAMTLPKAEVLHTYLHLMYNQGSRDLTLFERGIDSLYVLGQDSVRIQWEQKLRALTPAPYAPANTHHTLPPPEQPPE